MIYYYFDTIDTEWVTTVIRFFGQMPKYALAKSRI